MAHLRIRQIEATIKKLMSVSPLVGLLGHRQVGKTTVLEKLCKDYYVLDIKKESDLVNLDPDQYIKERAGHWVGFDECQSVPTLFPSLKEWVRKNKKPGQFILSGSVKFTSREQIKESLAGRIMTTELLPLSLVELEQEPKTEHLQKLIDAKDLISFIGQNPLEPQKIKKFHSRLPQYFEQGGLPGICLIRDQKLRDSKIREQLLTILDRDLRKVKNILVPYNDILRLVEALARTQGLPIDMTQLKKETGLSTPTIKKIIYTLEAVYIIRIINIEGSTKGQTVFFEDQGERRFLIGENPSLTENLSHFLFTNLRPQLEYQSSENIKYFQYRTRGGAFVPFCISKNQKTIGFIPLENPEDYEHKLSAANSFLGAYNNAKIIFVRNEKSNLKVIRPYILLAPVGYLIS